jgi:hypothetical protein
MVEHKGDLADGVDRLTQLGLDFIYSNSPPSCPDARGRGSFRW